MKKELDKLMRAWARVDREARSLLYTDGSDEVTGKILADAAGDIATAVATIETMVADFEVFEVRQTLIDAIEYFDDSADADQPPGELPNPNTELQLLSELKDALKRVERIME